MKKKLFTAVFTALLAVCVAALLVACGGAGVAIKLNRTSLTLNAGGTSGTVTATVDGSDEAVTWAISDESVASVSTSGNTCVVKPLKEGEAVLSAKIGNTEAKCTVSVGPVIEVEVVTISNDGEALENNAKLSVERGGTINLSAKASKGSDVSWSSSNSAVAEVANGVVTAKLPGTTVITAYVSSSVRASVTLTVTAPAGSDYYNLQYAAEGATEDSEGNAITQDKFFYWSAKAIWGQQEVVVDYAYFDDGVVSFSYTSDWDPGYSYGFQLFYKNSKQTLNSYYKLSCKIKVDVACTVTLNGNVIELKQGENNVTVYYQFTDQLGSGDKYGISSFDLIMGYADGTATGSFVKDATVSVSDVAWEEDAQEKLAAPSFTYNAESGVVTIAQSVAGAGSYRLNFYEADNKTVGSVAVESGKAIDTSRIPNGTYTVKLVAVAANAHYIDSDPSATSVTVTVNNSGGIFYTLDKNNGGTDAVATPGEWTYWTESWVTFQGQFADGKLTVTFENNAGNWYDTQLFYQQPGAENGKTYEFTLEITSSANGKVTIAGAVVDLEEGTHTYKATVTQSSAATLQILFGTAEQGAGAQDIKAGTISIAIAGVKEAELPSGTFSFGEEGAAVANAGTFYYWNDQGWVGSNVTVSSATAANGSATITYSGATTACWFGLQLFCKDSSVADGKQYTLTLKINASAAGSITVNGTVVELKEGDNNISVTFTQEADKASLSIQFGTEEPASVIASGTFTVSDIAYTEA